MHHQIFMIHHSIPTQDARCYLFSAWDLNDPVPAIKRLAQAMPENTRKTKWTDEQEVWRAWRAAGNEPVISAREWHIFAEKDFSKRMFYRELKRVWLLGWDPICPGGMIKAKIA